MSIYDEISQEIMSMKIDKGNARGVKLYKPLLILSMLDYHLDKGDENKAFNNPTHIENLVDFFTIYLENELIKETTYRNDSNRFSRQAILKTMRELPLYHITFTRNKMKSQFFKNDLPNFMEKKPRRNDNMATVFEISIPYNVDLYKMCNVIRSACYERIFKETGISIQGSVVIDLRSDNINKSTYYRRGHDQYRRKMIEKYECKCAFCSFDVEHTLISSHAKPWRDCVTVEEKLSEDNGFLLCATHDKMFDQGYLSINIYTGELMISNALKNKEIESCKSTLPKNLNVELNAQMKKFLKYHSENIFKGI